MKHDPIPNTSLQSSDWLALLLHICEVHGSIISPEASYPKFFFFFSLYRQPTEHTHNTQKQHTSVSFQILTCWPQSCSSLNLYKMLTHIMDDWNTEFLLWKLHNMNIHMDHKHIKHSVKFFLRNNFFLFI